MFGGLFQQNSHGWAFVHKHSDVALRLSQRQGSFQRRESRRDVVLLMVSKCLQYQDFDDASRPITFFRRLQEALEEAQCLTKGAVCTVALVLSQEQPGQGDVLELAQVAEVVLSG